MIREREKKVLILISVELGKVSQALSRLVVIAERERERERERDREGVSVLVLEVSMCLALRESSMMLGMYISKKKKRGDPGFCFIKNYKSH